MGAFSPIQSTNSNILGNVLTVEGTDKAPTDVYPGDTENIMLNFTLNTTYGAVTVTQIEVNRTGTSSVQGDISEATLWDDVNDNGAYDSGTDTLLASGTYSNGIYIFSSLSITVNPGTEEFLLIMYNISASSNTGVTVGARIDGADNITVQSPDTVASFSPIQSTNTNILADTLTVTGTNQAPSEVKPGTNNLVMLKLTFTADDSITITQIEVNRTGTSTQESELSAVNLYEDVNDNGIYDSGTDTFVAEGTYSNGIYTFSGLSEVVNTGTPMNYLVMYKISASANTGVTVGARLDGYDNIKLKC